MSTSFGNVRHTVRWTVLLAASLICCSSGSASADTLLRWKFNPGESLKYTMTMAMSQEMNVNGTAVKTNVDQIVDYTWTTGSVDADGSAAMSQTMDRVRMEMKAPQGAGGQTIKYDSANEEKPTDPAGTMFAQMLGPMIGKTMTMHISSRGEISEFKAPEDMFDGIKKVPGMQQMGGVFSEQGLKQMVTQAMLKFPEKEIVKGDSWTSLLEMPNPAFGNQKIETTYTYAGSDTVDGHQAETIDLKLNMTFTPAKDSPTKVELKDQASKGMIHFDNAKGRLFDSENTLTMKMEITVGAMKFESNTSVGTTLKRNEDKKSSSQPAEK